MPRPSARTSSAPGPASEPRRRRHRRAEERGQRCAHRLPARRLSRSRHQHRSGGRPRRERRRRDRAGPAVLRSGHGRRRHPEGDPGRSGGRIPPAPRFRRGRRDHRARRHSGAGHDLLEPGRAVRRRPVRRRTRRRGRGGAHHARPDSRRGGRVARRPPTAPASTGSSSPLPHRPTSACARPSRRAAASSTRSRPWASRALEPMSTAAARGLVSRLRAAGATSACVGLGISTAEQVREVLEYADGAIVGSMLVKALADGGVDAVAKAAALLASGKSHAGAH